MELFKILGTIAINNSDAIKGLKDTTNQADNTSSKVGVALEKMGATALKVGKVMATAMGAGITALSALTKASLDAYAQYEQLVGGVETLFGAGGLSLEEYAKSVGKTVDECKTEYYDLLSAERAVMDNARKAFETAGMSANEYMETVTSFSASLIQSLEGDTVEATRLADQAIIDMSDNANKMGTDMQMIQNAYNGFAKQNYMMLDNLKLGYGGTKAEMERLLEDAEEIQRRNGNIVDYSIESYADVINAIHDVQTEMGITGTTAKEAEKTISGSLSAMRASWKNLVTGLGNDKADLQRLINEFVDSTVTASENILPRIQIILGGIADLVQQLVPMITEMFPEMIEEVLPPLLDATATLIKGIADAIPDLLNMLLKVLPKFVNLGVEMIGSILTGISKNLSSIGESATLIVINLVTGIMELLPQFLEVGIQLIVSIIEGITESLPDIIDTIVDVVLQLVDVWFENLPLIYEAGLELIVKLVEGILEALPDLLQKMPEIIQQMVEALLSVINLIIDAGVQLLTALVDNLPLIIQTIVAVLPQIITAIISTLLSEDGISSIVQAGVELLTSLIDNIDEIVLTVVGAIPALISGILGAIINTDNLASMADAGMDIIYAVLSGLQSAWETVVGWAEGVVSWLEELFNIDINVGVTTTNTYTGGTGENRSWNSERPNNSSNSNGMNRASGSTSNTKGTGSTGNKSGTSNGMNRVGQYAEGGVVPKGHIAFLEGYGTEAVVPLEKNKEWIDKVARDMDSALGGNGSSQKLDKLIELQEQMLAILPELANISISLNNREFGRAVRQVT